MSFCLLLFLALMTAWVNDSIGQTDPIAGAPNVVFLLTDDQATITMGCYGNQTVKTPNLDSLATRGVVFDRHYVTTAICMASRANIFTGLYEYRTGCNFTKSNLQPAHWQTSYPMRFRESGYRTAFAGKFGIEIDGRKTLPHDDFDRWGGGPGQTHYETFKNKSMKSYANDYPHSTRAYAAFGKDFIRESVAAKKPFCLSISFKASHRPVTPDPEFDDVYKNTVFQPPVNFGRDHGQHLAAQSKTGRQYPRFKTWGYADNYNEVMRKYNQQIYGVDVAVGEILAELKSLGISDNTIVIFTSDNGFMCGAHGYGSKVIPYEESARVPLIILDPRQPKRTRGQRSQSLTGSIDLCPTMLDLAGLPLPEDIDGVSLAPILRDPSAEVRTRLSLMNFWGPRSTHSFGIVTQRWKYLYWYSQENNMLATEELFDLGNDPLELVNVVGDPTQQATLDRMRELYAAQVYELKDKSIDSSYSVYAQLFDRRLPWETKADLLKNR